MSKILTLFVILVSTFSLQTTQVFAAQDQCQNLSDYFDEVDQRMGKAFITVLEDDEWRADLEYSIAKANRSDLSILVLSPEEMEPLIRLMSIPGDVLLEFPEEKVPTVAEELHDSALELWLLFPALFRTLASSGMFSALAFAEEMEQLEHTNLEAQKSIEASCPAEIEEIRVLSEQADQADDLLNPEDPSVLENIAPGNFQGVSYGLLFFASEDEPNDSTQLPSTSDDDLTSQEIEAAGDEQPQEATSGRPHIPASERRSVDTVTPEPSGPDGAGYDLSEAPFYSDGDLWGEPSERLAFADEAVVFTPYPDSVPLDEVGWDDMPRLDGQQLAPLGRAYPGEDGTLIPTERAWVLVTEGDAAIVDANPYGEIGLVRSNFAESLITYVAGGELIIADRAAPGTAIATLPFSGVDYDLSPATDRIVISTGQGLEIWSRDGQRLGASGTGTETGSVLWLNDGIVLIDQSNNVIRLVDPAALTP